MVKPAQNRAAVAASSSNVGGDASSSGAGFTTTLQDARAISTQTVTAGNKSLIAAANEYVLTTDYATYLADSSIRPAKLGEILSRYNGKVVTVSRTAAGDVWVFADGTPAFKSGSTLNNYYSDARALRMQNLSWRSALRARAAAAEGLFTTARTAHAVAASAAEAAVAAEVAAAQELAAHVARLSAQTVVQQELIDAAAVRALSVAGAEEIDQLLFSLVPNEVESGELVMGATTSRFRALIRQLRLLRGGSRVHPLNAAGEVEGAEATAGWGSRVHPVSGSGELIENSMASFAIGDGDAALLRAASRLSEPTAAELASVTNYTLTTRAAVASQRFISTAEAGLFARIGVTGLARSAWGAANIALMGYTLGEMVVPVGDALISLLQGGSSTATPVQHYTQHTTDTLHKAVLKIRESYPSVNRMLLNNDWAINARDKALAQLEASYAASGDSQGYHSPEAREAYRREKIHINSGRQQGAWGIFRSVSYTHLTLPTILLV